MSTEKSDNTSLSLPLPWQLNLWDDFISRLERQKLPHGLLLHGPDGIGIEYFVLALAQRVLCVSPENNYACGHCKACQLLKAKTHPDLIFVEPDEPGRFIRVPHIRSLCASLENTAQQGGWKVAIINPADAMNRAAYNALLKNLEEPQPNTLLILMSHRAGQIPATIRSRCQIENMPIPHREDALAWLNTVVEENDKNIEMLNVARGLPLLALQYLRGDGLEERQQMEALLEAIRQGEKLPSEAAQQCQKYDADSAINWTMSYLHHLATGELKDRPIPALFDFSDKLSKARVWLLSRSNINNQLLWEELFMEWSQVFRQRK